MIWSSPRRGSKHIIRTHQLIGSEHHPAAPWPRPTRVLDMLGPDRAETIGSNVGSGSAAI
jgi:hypothetical protein